MPPPVVCWSSSSQFPRGFIVWPKQDDETQEKTLPDSSQFPCSGSVAGLTWGQYDSEKHYQYGNPAVTALWDLWPLFFLKRKHFPSMESTVSPYLFRRQSMSVCYTCHFFRETNSPAQSGILRRLDLIHQIPYYGRPVVLLISWRIQISLQHDNTLLGKSFWD